ncbi:TPM domain-containing protein [Kamptonema sp. UHCC 0994]|uniref:photosystem II repair protein Psb32 n=1 Tax=Kamptonema sp. UHCC 0994 TaxID=3031329 RepID=UPI0023B89A51|nr:TPM domain-containing protein [Kamptonema sp. UHCC 0994]MDF0552495.1 TPM domain-containing protein [Kamptonema sp. UHCC 0994]
MIKLLHKVFNCKKYLQRLMLAIALMVFATQMLALPAQATGVYEIPNLSPGDRTWVIDKGEILSRISESNISSVLDNLEKQTGNQVRFVTIHRFDYGETAASFAEKLFQKWFPTPETQANQIVLVLDTVTNNTAIRTGEGVKSLLSDDIAKSVADETVQVPLRQGNKYNEAFLAAGDRIAAVISGKPDPGPPQVVDNVQVEGTFKRAEETDTGNATLIVVVLLVLATVIPMVTYFWYQGFN